MQSFVSNFLGHLNSLKKNFITFIRVITVHCVEMLSFFTRQLNWKQNICVWKLFTYYNIETSSPSKTWARSTSTCYEDFNRTSGVYRISILMKSDQNKLLLDFKLSEQIFFFLLIFVVKNIFFYLEATNLLT
jgi:hypothetical protein